MLGTFTYHNPTRLHFGPAALKRLPRELAQYGDKVLLVYGGGSIKKSGLYDQIREILNQAGKTVIDFPGVMSNPTLAKLKEGAALARQEQVDLILAVGGGSVIDYAKAVSVSAYCTDDPWKKYFLENQKVDNPVLPVGTILTMVGTASEMNGGAVITDQESQLKLARIFPAEVYPKFSLVNPEWTYTLPHYQMVAGIFDTMSHIMEQYFSGQDDNTSDYIMEGLMRSLIYSSRQALQDPTDYQARSNLAWTATWALNGLIGKGKQQDWMVHMIGQAIGGVTDATHGMTLSAISPAYYRLILPQGLPQFVRFATNVWQVDRGTRTDEEIAELGIQAMEDWMTDLGLVRHLTDLGLQPDQFDQVIKGTLLLGTGYRKLSEEDVRLILQTSL